MADFHDEEPETPIEAVESPIFLPSMVEGSYPRLWMVAKELDLYKLTLAQIKAKYEHPCYLVKEANARGSKCSFALAAAIMRACGWAQPEKPYEDLNVPPQSLKKYEYGPTEVVPLSRYFLKARVGDRVWRREGNTLWIATVLKNGKLLSHHNRDIMSPTAWARLVLGREGRMPIMPRTFWRRVGLLKPGEPEPEMDEPTIHDLGDSDS